MANLRVGKITSTETFEKTGSVQFDGTGDYLSTSKSGFTNIASTDAFTVEAFVYFNDLGNYDTIFASSEDSFTSGGFKLEIYDSKLRVQANNFDSSDYNNGATTLSTGRWHHIAFSRTSDGNAYIFLDGVLYFSGSAAFEVTWPRDVGIGGKTDNTEHLNGYISNLRFCYKKALYTSNFKPPMRELEITPETVLLACQSKTDAILEKTGKTITANGNAVASELTPGILTPVPKTGAGSAITGSVEFNGTGDCLTAPDGSDFEFGSDNFTIEAYIYYTGSPGTSGDTYVITSKWDNQSAPNDKGLILRISDDGSGDNLQWFYTTDGSTNEITTGSTILIPESWYHIAFVRNGTVGTFYINGIADATTVSFGSDSIRDTGNPFRIGANLESGAIDQEFQGFISNLRVIKGTALYTEDFIPPTRELKKVPGTVLLCCQDPDSPLTEATGKTITGFGDLDQVYDTQLVPNGDFSDGTNDWSDTGSTATLSVSSGQLTITNSSGTNGRATSTAFNTTIGARYVLKYDAITSGGSYRAEIRQASGGGAEQAFQSTTDGATETFEFQATHSRHSVVIYSIGANGVATKYDNVYVYKVLPGKTGSNFTPQVGDDRKITFEGVTKVNSDAYFYLPTGNTESRYLNVASQASSSARGVFAGGAEGGAINEINYITIPSTGDALDFGDLLAIYYLQGSCSSSTRGVVAGGNIPESDVIQYVTIPSKGNAKDFGDLVNAKRNFCGSGSQTRGIFFNGLQPGPTYTNTIEYITIATTGNAKDFGDSTDTRLVMGSCSNPTRCIQFGGSTPSGAQNAIDFVTIQTLGNAQDFGDLITANNGGPQLACSSSTRGLFGGGRNAPSNNQTNTIEFVTISSTGNATDFGDLITARRFGSTCSSLIRGIFAGGTTTPGGNVNVVEYVNIASTGDAANFGDLPSAMFSMAGMSSGHGGLG